MIKTLLENVKKTNDCIVLAIPMVLFFLLTQAYLSSIQNIALDTKNLIFIFVTLWIWFSGSFAGWFYMVKKTLLLSKRTFVYEKDRNKALYDLFKCLFNGIGRLFLSFLVVVLFLFMLNVLKWVLGVKLLMDTDFDFKVVLITDIFLSSIVCYFILFWIPEIVYAQKNPFIALINSIKKSVKFFKHIIFMYVSIVLAAFGVIYVLSIFNLHPVCYFFMLLFAYYFIIYSVVTVFTYYEKLFIS